MLKLILCLDLENGISRKGSIPWKINEELEHFRNTTSHHIIVMGRKTFDVIQKPLPNRKNIVFSNNNIDCDNIEVTNDISYIVQLSKQEDVFIIGGKALALLFMPHIDEIILSKLNEAYKCDLFININLDDFVSYQFKKFKNFSITWYKKIDSKILYGTKVADEQLKLVKEKSNNLYKKHKIFPMLAIIIFDDSFDNNKYILAKQKIANLINVKTKIYSIKNDSLTGIEDLIIELNTDQNIHGILIQHPFPSKGNIQSAFRLIDSKKDVDCFSPFNISNIWFDNKENNIIYPCTAKAIISLIKFYQIEISSKRVVIVGRSIIVGRPLFLLFLNEHATVTICHSKTTDLKSVCLEADILICGIGKPYFFDDTYIKENAIVIDVGINKSKDNQIIGDVDFHKVYNKVKYITPVPKGVGPLTIVELFNNLLTLYEIQNHNRAK